MHKTQPGPSSIRTLKAEYYSLRAEVDIVNIRQQVRLWATQEKFSIVDQTKIVTAASELARNTLIHGKGGTAQMEVISDGYKRGIRLTFQDHGPGIADMELAMKDGFTTGLGLGLGLGGSKRLMNEFFIKSDPGRGTCVVITKWK